MDLKKGEIIILNNKEYICVHSTNYENEIYLYLIGNFKPTEFKFVKNLGNGQFEIINNKEEKNKLLQLFKR